MQEMEIKEKVIRVICQHLGIKELTEEFCTKPNGVNIKTRK